MYQRSCRIGLVICIIMLYAWRVNAQMAAPQWKGYYALVQRANAHLAKGEPEEATRLFSEAFSKIPNPFFIDLNNAIYSEIQQKRPDTSRIISYLRRIQRKGFCIHEQYGKNQLYAKYLAKVSEDSCKVISDPAGRELIDQCIKRDQVLRVFCSEVLMTPYDSTVRPAIEKLDSVNYGIVVSFLNRTSFTGESLEEMIGYEAVEDLNIILQHNATWGRVDFVTVIKSVKNGLLEARREACLMDAWCGATFFYQGSPSWKSEHNCDKVFGLYGTIASAIMGEIVFVSKVKDDGLATVIKNRRDEIFLGDVYDDAKLTAFAYYNRAFRYPGIVVLGDNSMGKMLEERLKKKGFVFISYHGKEDFDFNRSW